MVENTRVNWSFYRQQGVTCRKAETTRNAGKHMEDDHRRPFHATIPAPQEIRHVGHGRAVRRPGSHPGHEEIGDDERPDDSLSITGLGEAPEEGIVAESR